MKLKQFVIRMRRDGRGTDYGIVTDDPLDVYAKCVELGMLDLEAKKLMDWSKRAHFGASGRPLGNCLCGHAMVTVEIVCRDPGRKAIVIPKQKRGREKGDPDVE